MLYKHFSRLGLRLTFDRNLQQTLLLQLLISCRSDLGFKETSVWSHVNMGGDDAKKDSIDYLKPHTEQRSDV